MTPLTQQLEDKKKEDLYSFNSIKGVLKDGHIMMEYDIVKELNGWRNEARSFRNKNALLLKEVGKLQQELEQAIAEIKKKDEVINFYAETLKETNEEHKAEMQKQKQEILDKIEDHMIAHLNESYNYHIFDDLKQQLNQPKTEQ